MFANLVNRNNVRMIQPRRRARLDLKALHQCGAGEFTPGNHLQRHHAVQADLPRSIHHTHAAARNLGAEFVIAENPRTEDRGQRTEVRGQRSESGVVPQGAARLLISDLRLLISVL
jgi:hypothetical protein